MSLLAIKDLQLSINGTEILRDIDLTVEAGEIVAITGESGSGKSMTALTVMGLTPDGTKTSGEVLLSDQSILSMLEPDLCHLRGREMGMIFQEPMTALNPVQTIGTQVAETIRLHDGATKSEALSRATKVLERVGLSMSPNRFPHELSGGQRQRVVIAIAIAMRPKLLIADEPTTALDVTTQATILDLLKDLVKEFQMGLLLITHDLAVVSDVADRIVVMQKGAVVETGATKSLFRDMKHPYTKALFAASSHQPDMPDNVVAQPLLRVQGVNRDYPVPRKSILGERQTFRALSDINFEIAHSERVGLVGESGCGKSTLTRAILGLDPISSGQITLNEESVHTGKKPNRALRRKMQVVFQDPYSSFNPRHRVGKLVSEPFHLLDTVPPDRDALIAQALTDVGLHPDDANKYIHEFSGGQRQRIAIARALIINPELIVFDEAVSALDVSVRAQVLDLLAELCEKRPLAYLFISHDLSVVRSVTDRVLVMKEGRIVEQGETEAIFNAAQHPYTKSLLAASPRLPDIKRSA